MKKSLIFILMVIFLFSGVSATIANVHTEPLYPNLDASLIKVYAEVSDVQSANLYYQITGDSRIRESTIFIEPFSGGLAEIGIRNPKDNTIVNYYIEIFDSNWNVVDNTSWSTFTYDGTAPTITLVGENPTIIAINSTYDELGASASDSIYGDLSSNVTISGSVDTNTLGEYTITYAVSDLAGNSATATRTVRVIEPVSVSVSISGGSAPYSASGSGSNNSAINNTTDSLETANSEEQLQNSDTSSKAGITGKSIIELIGENRGISIFIGVLAIAGVIGYFFIKKEMKRRMWGK